MGAPADAAEYSRIAAAPLADRSTDGDRYRRRAGPWAGLVFRVVRAPRPGDFEALYTLECGAYGWTGDAATLAREFEVVE